MNPIEKAIEGYCQQHPQRQQAVERLIEKWVLPNGRVQNNDAVLSAIRELFKKRKPKAPIARRDSR